MKELKTWNKYEIIVSVKQNRFKKWQLRNLAEGHGMGDISVYVFY